MMPLDARSSTFSPRSSRAYAAIAAGALACAFCGSFTIASGQLREPPAPTSSIEAPVEQRLAAAVSSMDDQAADALFDRLWKADANKALSRAMTMLGSGRGHERVIAATAIARNATPVQIARAAESARTPGQIGERRWLVRSLGAHPAADALPLLRAFLNDQKRIVQVAAIQAIAELNAREGFELVLPRFTPQAPANKGNANCDGSDMLALSHYGLARAFLGDTPDDLQSTRVMSEDARAGRRSNKPVAAGEEVFEPAQRRGQTVYRSPSFEVSIRLSKPATPDQIPAGKSGTLAPMIESSAKRSLRAAEPIVGRVFLPRLRLIIADQKTFSGLASAPTTFGGVSKCNEIVLNYNPLSSPIVLVHEYVHAIHSATFDNQPRWISEGLAESLTLSSTMSAWNMLRVRSSGLEGKLGKSIVTEALQWKSGAVTGEREALLYAQSHLLVNFLRYGPFASAPARLASFMARLSRGENPQTVLQDLYRATPGDMDRWIAQWLQQP